ncbi:MAG: lytic transglycosylase domain-containing protein [Spirochaetaceae bacterium]
MFVFNKNTKKQYLSILTLIIVILLVNSCSLGRVFGLKKEDFLGKVSRKDYGFLSEVDYLKNSITEINRLGDGASYYMSFVYKNNNMLLFSNKLLYQEIQNKHAFYGPKAAFQLLKQLLHEKDYIKAEAHALDFYDIYDGDYPGIRKQYIEALYWQRKDDQVVPYISNLDRSLYSDYSNYELDMLKCVSSARLNSSDWEDQYRSLFYNQPLSHLLTRAYSFIDVYPDYGKGFSKDEKLTFKALAAASSGKYNSAQDMLRPLLYKNAEIFSTKQSIKNVSKIIKSSNVITLNLDAFYYAMENSIDDRKDDALVAYAALFFKRNSYRAVVELLEDSLEDMPIGNTKDDGIWYYLLSLSHVKTESVVSNLKFYVGQLSDNNYASDIIDHVITALVQNKEWDSVLEIESVVKKSGSIQDQSRVSWILSRIYFHNFIYSDNKEKIIEEALDSIVTSDSSSYYSYIANALLKRESNLVLLEPKDSTELTDDDFWIHGFLTYGLEDESLLFTKQVKDLNYDVAIELATLLDSEDKHLETLRFLSKSSVPLNSESFPLYYPLPYKDKIVEIASAYNFPATLFSGLIRTESGFDMDVVSSAGAVGLSQLMPRTAVEQATDLGLGTPDLTDPDMNILLGGTYIDWLVDRFYTLSISCMAYNAGPGNVWRWQKLWGDLPDELFIEAAPFKETRDYVPKIVRSAIYYGHEEFDVTPYDVVKQIFPDID